MNKPIVKDIFFLGLKSIEATQDDMGIVEDLKDTLDANKKFCVGLAANMIGFNKRIIIVKTGMGSKVMINPVITKKSGKFTAVECCLSLDGGREATRYKNIEVKYLDTRFKQRKEKYSGYVAQTIQHEVDHLEGIII